RAGGEDEGRPRRERVSARWAVAQEEGGAKANASDAAAEKRPPEGIDSPAAGGEVDAKQAPEVAEGAVHLYVYCSASGAVLRGPHTAPRGAAGARWRRGTRAPLGACRR